MEHHYCLFYKNDKLQFGWIREVRKSKLVVVPEAGKEFNCASSRVEYSWKGKDIAVEKEAVSYIAIKSAWTRDVSTKIELEVIHELCEPGETHTLDDLADNFLEEPENGWLRAALLIRLKTDQLLFQQKKNQFLARSPEEIQEVKDKEIKKQEANERRIRESEWAESLLNSKKPDISPDEEKDWQHFIHRLRNFLIHLDRSQEKDYFCSLFQCQISNTDVTERRLLNYLAFADETMSWGKLILARASVSSEFEDEIMEATRSLMEADIWKSSFGIETRDQRNLETYTIDNIETRDFDDALSYEKTDHGSIVRIHISDVASFIKKDSPLFSAASDRISSLYTVKNVFPMLPPVLSEDFFSLKEGIDKPVLTYEIFFDEEGHLKQTDIYRSIINVNKNCSYEEIDGRIQDEEVYWKDLSNICILRRQYRIDNGSLELDRIEVKLDISDPDSIKIKAVRENTPASAMIQELAILANHITATFAKENGLTCLFRNQPPYSIKKDLEENVKPTLKDINIQPARISLEPDNHSALGLDCYLHVTSPIRRFLDLINQGIILAKLGDREISYSSDELLIWAKRGEEIQREYSQIERKLLDHWKIKYLAQNSDELYEVQVIRQFRNGKSLINILRLQLIIEASINISPEDDVFQVAIDRVTPEYNRVVVRKCKETDQKSAEDSDEEMVGENTESQQTLIQDLCDV